MPLLRLTWVSVVMVLCSAAALSCSRSRHRSEGGAAHGGEPAGKGGEAGKGGKGGAGSLAAGEGGQGSKAGKGGAGAAAAGTNGLIPVEGGFCCVPSASPGCCMDYGGFTKDRKSGCRSACDGMPLPSEAWKLESDEHGCKYWVEPREWMDCCGCGPNPHACSAKGKWRIEFEDTGAGGCGLLGLTFSVSSEDDAGTAQVTFENLGARSWNCGGTPEPRYEATVSSSPNGCVVSLASHAKWCSGSEPQCEDLDLKLYLKAFSEDGEVEGTYRKCWCGSSGPEGTTVQLEGIAKPVE